MKVSSRSRQRSGSPPRRWAWLSRPVLRRRRVAPAQQGGLGRGNHRVSAGQRAAGVALSRSVAAQGHRQPDRLRRLAARGLRRDGHGPPAGAHGVQGNARPSRHPRRHEGAGSSVQRLDIVRPYQLLRDAVGQRREPGVRHQARGRPDGEQPHQGRGPRHRVLGGSQRIRDG